ncbi:MAG: CNNM domain-containing protein [bacterium]
MVTVGIISIITLLLLSAFFSGSETALVSLSRYRLKRLIIKNKNYTDSFMWWLTAPEYILTTILIGNTFVNIAMTSLSALLALHVFNQLPQEWVKTGVWICMMIIILMWGEITPKIYSRRHSEKVSLFAIPLLYYVSRAIKPLVHMVLWIINRLAPGFTALPISKYSHVTSDELQTMITESGLRGGLGILTGEMMKKVLSINTLMAEKIMTPLSKLETVQFPENVLDEHEWKNLYARIIEAGHTRVLVCKGEKSHIEGYIHINDLIGPREKDRTHIIRAGINVDGRKKVSELLKEFKNGRTHLAFVRDAKGMVRGIVTLEDVLEAIVGEILDEFDLQRIGAF